MNNLFDLSIAIESKIPGFSGVGKLVAFFADDENLKSNFNTFIKENSLTVSASLKQKFLKDENPLLIHTKDNNAEVLFVKVKLKEHNAVDYFRNFLAGEIQHVKGSVVEHLHVIIPPMNAFEKYFTDEEYYYSTFIEGVLFGNYTFRKFKTEKDEIKKLKVSFSAPDKKKLSFAHSKTLNLMKGVYFTRDLQNEPANALTPAIFAARIKSTLQREGVKVTVLNEKAIAKLKMGGLQAVGSGSNHPPRFIKIEYTPVIKRGVKKPKHIALVGKGITFDSGGISLKPAPDMGEMKADMSGGAVVAGTILTAARLKMNVKITGLIPAAENMPSGSAMRPGDIITTSSGTTIEVDNTDAEGRLILADALHYASRLKPDAIIDLATLTGACVVALGEFAAGLFTKSETLADSLYQSGLKTFDRVWRLPMWDDYAVLIKSDVADVKNVGGRWGGAITAAKFLEKWVASSIPWAHIDIAPAMPNNLNNYTKTSMTGFGVRLLIDFLEKLK